jgi:hypothetical protein
VAFIAIAASKEEPLPSIIVAGFGLVVSVAWVMVNRGSKYWQEQWESKIEKAENRVTGPLFKNREPEQNKGWWSGRKYSVSKVTIAVSEYAVFIWICILERIIEKAGDVEVTASAVVAAIQAYAKINAHGQWVDQSEQVTLTQLFERMTRQELEAYARNGKLPDWFPGWVTTDPPMLRTENV